MKPAVSVSTRRVFRVTRVRPELDWDPMIGTTETGRSVTFAKNYFSESAAYMQVAKWAIYDKRHEVGCSDRYGHIDEGCPEGRECPLLQEQNPQWRRTAKRLARWLRWRDRLIARRANESVFPLTLPDGSPNVAGLDSLLRKGDA